MALQCEGELGRRLMPGRARDQACGVGRREPLERALHQETVTAQVVQEVAQAVVLAESRPAEREEDQQWSRKARARKPREQRNGRSVDPLHVIEHEHHRALRGELREHLGDGGERSPRGALGLANRRRGARRQNGNEANELAARLCRPTLALIRLRTRNELRQRIGEHLVGGQHRGARGMAVDGETRGQRGLPHARMPGHRRYERALGERPAVRL